MGKFMVLFLFLLNKTALPYPQSMFWSKNKKYTYTPAYPSLATYKWSVMVYSLHAHVFDKPRLTLTYFQQQEMDQYLEFQIWK